MIIKIEDIKVGQMYGWFSGNQILHKKYREEIKIINVSYRDKCITIRKIKAYAGYLKEGEEITCSFDIFNAWILTGDGCLIKIKCSKCLI